MPHFVETFVDSQRPRVLSLARLAGAVHGRISRGWLRVAFWLVTACVALLLVPAAINVLLGAIPDGVWDALEAGDPQVGDLWSIWSVLGLAAAILTLRWLVQARDRVVVEEFVDYTSDDAKAVKGLATLLISELSRLQELYGRVNDELSTPMSVGVSGRGGTGRGTQPGTYLSVSADEVTSTLNDAIATEMSVSFGGIKIPIGFVLSLAGRLARGPRVAGSLHFTDAAGGPKLTAQIVGRGKVQQWRVDAAQPAGEMTLDKAFLDPMVTELACRMFNDLTLRGSVRWRAIRSFTEHLELYWESYRTPRDRAAKLERAEGKLLAAIAEDENFDLAFYNLGVVYSQLADTELAAAENSDYVKRGDRPLAAHRARLDAALVAFNRAVFLNRDRAEAIYALAVHEYTGTTTPDHKTLQAIVCRCERVLELRPDHAQAHELMGRALIDLERAPDGEKSLRAAVTQSWRRLWLIEFRERSSPPTVDSQLSGAQANVAAALRKLAKLTFDQADGDAPTLDRADRLFGQACDLATGDIKASTLWSHGQMLEAKGQAERACDRYHEALKIDPENPVYWAHLAAAWASKDVAQAQNFADGAYNELSPIYRRTLELHPSPTLVSMRDSTLDALDCMYAAQKDADGVARIHGLRSLANDLERATRDRDTRALRRIEARYGAGREWELEQVKIALARTLGRLDAWSEAATEYEKLIEMLEEGRREGLVQHSLRAKHARAQRKLGQYEEALVTAADGQLENPLSACARREVGKAHFALLHFDEALSAWQQTLWLTPNDPHLHWKVAFCHWSVAQDRHDEAARRAALLEAADGFEQAALLFSARHAEGWAWSQLWAGRVRRELGEHDAALSHLRSAASCTPTKLLAELLLGEVYAVVGDVGAGRVALESALQAVTPGTGSKVDADWGETLTDHEIAVRAAVALGRLELDAEGNARKARRRATDARGVTTGITLPAIRARCLASVAELERLAAGGARNGVALNGSA